MCFNFRLFVLRNKISFSVFIVFMISMITMLGSSLTSKGQSIHTLSGRVTDSLNNPVASATVFIVGMTKITSSSKEGTFRFDGLKTGTYQLSVSMIGFAKYNQTIFITDSSVNLKISLRPAVIQLTEVVINSGGSKEHENNLKIFKQVFLGESANSKKCRIVNPEVINLKFDKKGGILNAYADELIIVENRALGYKVRYSLENFSCQTAHDNASFSGNSTFEELPADEAQKKVWATARSKAYHGSLMHFFRGLYKNNVRKEGFIVHQAFEMVPVFGNSDGHEYVYIDPNEIDPHIISKLGADSLMMLQFTKLFIAYAPRQTLKQQLIVVDASKKAVPVMSNCTLFYMLKDGTLIDKKGDASNQHNYTIQGDMALRRVADQLPFEYEPEIK